MGHSVGEAAKRSTAKGEAQKVKVVTPEEMVRQVRLHVAQGLFVSNMDYIAATVAALDHAENTAKPCQSSFEEQVKTINTLHAENIELRAKLKEFRAVYDFENRSTTLKVERIPGADDAVAVREGRDG